MCITAGIDVETRVKSMKLEAELKDSSGAKSYTSLVAVTHQSPKFRHLQISTSTKNPKVS